MVILSVIVVLSVIIVALAVATRLERQAAHYHQARAQADLLAKEGVEYVKAGIQYATTDTNRQWITRPGQIISFTNGMADSSVEVINLFSGAATNSVASGHPLAAPDLNRRVLSDDSQPGIYPEANQEMRVSWVYIRKDGSRETNQFPNLLDKNNPIIGRFAYWADDESARIDLNTAWKKSGNTSSENHPSQVNLLAISGLSEEQANSLHTTAQATQFRSPGEARRLDATLATVLSSNRFDITHLSSSSTLNPWREPKVVLTTRTNNLPPFYPAGASAANYYLNIQADQTLDPGDRTSISSPKLIAILNRLMTLFSQTNWPYATNSLRAKYGDFNAAQIAIDIVEYTRSAESTNRFLQPLRVIYQGGTFSVVASLDSINSTNANVITGASRRPMITEMALWSSPLQTNATNNRKYLDWTAKVEICLPKNYQISRSDLVGKEMVIFFNFPVPDATAGQDFGDSLNTTVPGAGVPIDDSNTTYQEVGDYTFATFTISKRYEPFAVLAPNAKLYRPNEVWMRAKLQENANNYYELAPNATVSGIDAITNYYVRIPVDPVDSPFATSAQVADPRINRLRANWTTNAATFGNVSYNWTAGIAATPQQDRSGPGISGTASDASLIMPAPKGTTNNPTGTVSSIAELGRIGTGSGANIPWRSLRLQPTPNSSDLPDWALLDLFTAPMRPNTNSAQYWPGANNIAGRINLNAGIQPFTNILRETPLRAVFQDNPHWITTQIDPVLTNIIDRTLAVSGKSYGGTNGLASVGELAEIQGIADSGEASETALLGIADLASVQGNVFRVFSMGQSVQQTPSGQLVVQAEKSIVAIVERTSTGALRVVYWKAMPL